LDCAEFSVVMPAPPDNVGCDRHGLRGLPGEMPISPTGPVRSPSVCSGKEFKACRARPIKRISGLLV